MERVAEVDEAGHLFAARGVERAAAAHRVAGQHADRVAVQPRKADDQRAAVKSADLEKRIAIKDQAQNPSNVVGPAAVARDDRNQLLFAAARIVAGFDSRRQSPDVRRQVREEAADLREGFVLTFDFVVDRAAAAGVNARSAQFFFRDLLAYAAFDYRWAGDEELADASNHHRKMRMHDAHRAQSGAWA